jgi:N-acetylglucosamine-6-phosphate deacetylase
MGANGGPGGPETAPVRIAAPQVITAEAGARILSPGYVTISGSVVTDVGEGRPPAAPDIDLPDGTLVPGFVDLQVNGYFGADFRTAGADGWAAVVRGLPASGTTAFLPTLITAPLGELTATLRAAAALAPRLPFGARVLGVHMEGPFISPQRRGAHNADWIITPTPAAVDALIEAAGGLLRVLTLAPELPGALAAITQLSDAGVLVSMGHSDATAQQVALGAEHGARMVTHLFDGQRGLHHREPGVVGQALTDPRLTSGLIADLHHVCGPACQIAFAAAPGRIAIVTDAAACAGMPPGRYLLGGELIELPAGDGVPPVRADGTLAGSALRMDTGVANMVTAGVGLAAAVAAASRVPADLIGRPDLGRIAPGSAADLVWLGPDRRARATWIGGQRMEPGAAYAADGAAGIER